MELHDRNTATIANVPSFVHRAGRESRRRGARHRDRRHRLGRQLVFPDRSAPCAIEPGAIPALTEAALRIKQALVRDGVTGADGGEIDHIELFGPSPTGANSRNFVLCPGGAYDRSPCGTGHERQARLPGGAGSARAGRALGAGKRDRDALHRAATTSGENGAIQPRITGRAWVTAEATLVRDPSDPFPNGIGGRRKSEA